ncbi:MAG: phosphoglycerate kinase [Bacteroidia bacterium]|nr:MAG: phosphoglycerate kinase [Bacteroidia bacterium]
MKDINQFDFSQQTTLIRVDFNVPLDKDFKVTDDTRIQAALPTIKKASENGAVILMSHLGRPKNHEEKYSLKHILPKLEELLGKPVQFAADCIGEETKQKAKNLQPGEVLLLENLRYHPEEKKGDKHFAEKLSRLANVYINDAFGTAHRAHASTAIIADFFPENKMFGYLIQKEIEELQKISDNPERPFTAILGGAKISTKISVIEKLLDKVDHLLIGGAMTYTFIKAQGGKIGNSLAEDDYLDTALKICKLAKEKGVELHFPVDSLNADKLSPEAQVSFSKINETPDGKMGLDIGPKTIKIFEEIIKKSKTVLWNGPLGVFEIQQFAEGTLSIAKILAEATQNGAYTLIGGGDSVAALKSFDLEKQVSYVSTGGGAMLEFLEGKDLPGIAAVKK